jgi:hypothetical protein
LQKKRHIIRRQQLKEHHNQSKCRKIHVKQHAASRTTARINSEFSEKHRQLRAVFASHLITKLTLCRVPQNQVSEWLEKQPQHSIQRFSAKTCVDHACIHVMIKLKDKTSEASPGVTTENVIRGA